MHGAPITRTHWGLVLLLAATATAAYLCRVNISVAGVLVMQEYGLTQTQMGRVFSAFLAGYTLFMLPGGVLADTWGAKRTLAVLAWGWVAVTVLQAAVPAGSAAGSTLGVVGLLVALRFVMGVLAAPTYPAALEGASRWSAPAALGRANGLVIGSVGLGSAIAPPFITAVMVPWGWRAAMVASAIPALALAAVWLLVREPAGAARVVRDRAEAPRAGTEERGRESHLRVVARLLKAPGFALLTLSYTLQGYVGYIFIFWFYLYLVQVRHFSLVEGALISSLPWVLSAVSIPLGGVISDRLVQGRLGPVWGRRLIPIVGMGGAGVFISIGAHTTEAWLAALSLAVATALVLSVESPFWTTVAGLAGTRSGTGGAIMNTGCNIGGVVSPMLTPMLGEMFGWEPALHLAAGLSVLAALAWFWIRPAE
ncbi:MAG: MFS transporter [Vicinamibacterales bacterium]